MTTLYEMRSNSDGSFTFAPVLIDKQIVARPSIQHRLEVPWLSQLDPTAAYARGDCGTADMAMILNFIGKNVTVDEVSSATGKARGFTLLSWDDLLHAAEQWNVHLDHQLNVSVETMCTDIDAGKPVIALVDYKSLPSMNRFDKTYALGHFLLIVGYDEQSLIYHDPYWPDRTGGAFRTMTRTEFEHAYSTKAVGNQLARQCLRMV